MAKRITFRTVLAVSTATAVVVVSALPLMAQSGANPIARYEMRAETMSGIGAMGKGMGGAMSMMFGGGGGDRVQHMLDLELGSRNAPASGAPKADHFLPSGMKLGKSVALKTPVQTPPEPGNAEFQRPRGRMLIYWGCGEHAARGQPVVIDFSKLAAGQVPPGLFTTNVPLDRWISPASSRTYGHWPADDGKSAKSDSSLIGAHRVAGNYSPEMNFALTKDFMAPLRATNAAQPSGSTLVNWTAIPDATGYYAWVIGGKSGRGGGGEMTDVVWWTSSASRDFGGGLSDWLAPATVSRLVANRTVMSPQTTTCTVPAEVKRDAPDFMFGTLSAYGPEEDFAFPARPANPRTPWNPEWTARIRHKSTTTFLVGMPGMEGAEQQQQPQQQCQPKRGKGLGGALGGALGGVFGGGGGGNGC